MAKKIAMTIGVVFIAVGLLGFVSNPILGIFAAGTVHSLVHLISGIFLVWSSKKGTSNKALKIVGIVYGIVTILGFMMLGSNDTTNVLGLIDVNHADNWLHLILSAIILWAGFSKGGSAPMNNMNNMQRPMQQPPQGGMM